MSRGYNARRKAKRQEARVAIEPAADRRISLRSWRTLLPIMVIAGALALVGILGFGNSNDINKQQIDREVAALLDGIPQHGTVLGPPKAPVTLKFYADLECPTVRLFVEHYLPSVIDTWVRTGTVKLDYRSLETDTSDEEVFFEQEMAALAAARQSKLWNFALTFVREQGEPRTNYVTDNFIDGIASQVPDLELVKWRSERADALLSKRVALSVYSAHVQGARYTPSFFLDFNPDGAIKASTAHSLETTLRNILNSLQKETTEDFPSLQGAGPNPLQA